MHPFIQVPEHGRKLGSGQLISRHGASRRQCRRRCARGLGDNPWSPASRRAARRCRRRACPWGSPSWLPPRWAPPTPATMSWCRRTPVLPLPLPWSSWSSSVGSRNLRISSWSVDCAVVACELKGNKLWRRLNYCKTNARYRWHTHGVLKAICMASCAAAGG